MGEVFRETLSEEEEEDFRLEGTRILALFPGCSEMGMGPSGLPHALGTLQEICRPDRGQDPDCRWGW